MPYEKYSEKCLLPFELVTKQTAVFCGMIRWEWHTFFFVTRLAKDFGTLFIGLEECSFED
jgi:hypothetical protein